MNLIWLPAALMGGLFQAWRTASQERLRGTMSVSGAGLVRYLYGLPFALLFAGLWLGWHATPLPALTAAFLALAAAGGLCQMIGTLCLILAFSHRGFVVGTAFSKTEAIQAALFTALFFRQNFSLLVWTGIGLGVLGVLTLALGGQGMKARHIWPAMRQPAALYGLGAGAMFAFAAIAIKFATAQLSGVDLVGSALVTLVVVMAMQSALHIGWAAARDRATLIAVLRQYRPSAEIGLLSALGSACWYVGFAAAPAALVRIVGQVEVIFTIAFAHFYLRQPVRWHEAQGLALVATGVLLALAASL
ncbi:EamA family transporter [Sphingopyxis sp. MWB1]|uniref:EamA family transporter n=1 Tax=Sphingopyxis sp. MWB1 TaxID=1537715 RepID=UPI00051A049A|nr:EamA family transporter [Sphingopyxis sp. MWB1]